MNDTLHRLTIAMMARSLGNVAAIMDKAKAHAEAEGMPLDVLLQARLYPDMFNLLQQLQYVCFVPVDFARHLTAVPPPRVGYDETTWDELRASVAKTAEYLGLITPADAAAKAEAKVPLFMADDRLMSAIDYAAHVIVPDFYFHVSVAYAILRHNGVRLGKEDFLGALPSI